MVTGHEVETLRRQRISDLMQPLRLRWLSDSELMIGACWAVVLVVLSLGGLVDTLHG